MIGIGLMSGTSADSIDAACVRLEGAPPRLDWELLSFITLPMTQELRQEIFAPRYAAYPAPQPPSAR